MKRCFFLLLVLVCFQTANAQHTIVMHSGEKINGVVMAINDDVLTVAVNRELVNYDMINVSAIFFKEYVKYDGELLATEEIKTIRSGKYVVQYRMKDRTIIRAPKISVATQDKGIVVVDVVVNRHGNVIRATPGGVGSTTSSEYLYTKAKFAALGALFNEHPTGPLETKGTITITY